MHDADDAEHTSRVTMVVAMIGFAIVLRKLNSRALSRHLEYEIHVTHSTRARARPAGGPGALACDAQGAERRGQRGRGLLKRGHGSGRVLHGPQGHHKVKHCDEVPDSSNT